MRRTKSSVNAPAASLGFLGHNCSPGKLTWALLLLSAPRQPTFFGPPNENPARPMRSSKGGSREASQTNVIREGARTLIVRLYKPHSDNFGLGRNHLGDCARMARSRPVAPFLSCMSPIWRTFASCVRFEPSAKSAHAIYPLVR
jgi:hypothetical protein